jgi:hypothetical protein
MVTLRLLHFLLPFCSHADMYGDRLNPAAAGQSVVPGSSTTRLTNRKPRPLKSPQAEQSFVLSRTAMPAIFGGGREEKRIISKEEIIIKTPEELKNEAIKSIRNCCMYALAAGILGTTSFVVENRSNILNLTPLQGMRILGRLNSIVFGASLYRSLNIFGRGIKGRARLDAASTLEGAQVLSRMWGATAFIRSLQAQILSFSTGTAWFELLSAFVLTANVPFCYVLHRHKSQKSATETPVQPGYAPARRVMLTAVRNVLCCVLPIAIFGFTVLVKTGMEIIKAEHHSSRAWSLVNGILDSTEWIAIASLLAVLYQKLLRATLILTQYQKPTDRLANVGLFKVQAELYSKIGSIFAAELVFIVLPYILPVGTTLYGVYTTLDGIRGILFP